MATTHSVSSKLLLDSKVAKFGQNLLVDKFLLFENGQWEIRGLFFILLDNRQNNHTIFSCLSLHRWKVWHQIQKGERWTPNAVFTCSKFHSCLLAVYNVAFTCWKRQHYTVFHGFQQKNLTASKHEWK